MNAPALAYPLESLCRYCRQEYGDHIGRSVRCPGTTPRAGLPRKTSFYPAFDANGRDLFREDRMRRLRTAIARVERGIYSVEAAEILGCPHNTAAKYLEQLAELGEVVSYLVPRGSHGGQTGRPRRYYRVPTEKRS